MVNRRRVDAGGEAEPIPRFTWRKGESLEVVLSRVEKIQKLLFPNRISAVGPQYLEDGPPESRSSHNYMYYAPYRYVEMGAIDPSLLNRLKQGQTLLSVGSGHGVLEQFLQKVCQAKLDQITCADLHINTSLQESPLPALSLDMFGDWDQVGQFDEILFPESFEVAFFHQRNYEVKYDIDDFSDELEKVRYAFQTGRIEALTKEEINHFTRLAEDEIGGVETYLGVLRRALEHLKPGGEIRKADMITDCTIYAYFRLKEEIPSLQVRTSGNRMTGTVIFSEKV